MLTACSAGAARAYEFQLTYQYGGSVFNFGANGFQSAPVDETGTILASSDNAQPDALGFFDDNLRVTYVGSSDSFVVAATFPALGGTGYANALVDANGPLGDVSFGALGYGSDRDGQYFSGTVSGTFSISAVPLPASAGLFGAALAALGVAGAGLRSRKMRACQGGSRA